MSENEEASQASAAQGVLEDADENTLRIMLSTDNHLGYAERDPVRGMDSFAAFEEVLYLAKRFHCDMVLISGDLFHDNRPSRRTLYKTMEIIRRYCMGPNPVRIEILSDQAKNFRNVSGTVNYQDENYSVDLPIFSIHGNHDDPSRDTGGELLAALDLLSVSNLVNYFGRQEEVDKVEVSPVLVRKGITKVALYGMGSMRDERLNRMWKTKKVRFLRPEEDEDDEDDDDGFFNLFTLHQNRDLGRGSKNCVQESMIPEWIDVVVWGHEHECLIDFFESVVGTFRITQPGSSVATSLVSGEAVRKKVGILDIQGKNFRLHPIPLTQVRPFVTTEISLKEHRANLDPDDRRIDDKVTAVLEEEVRLMVLNAREKMQEVLEDARTAGSNAGEEDSPLKYRLEKPNEVLIRLRVEHSGFTSLNNQRFGAKFVGDVANPTDLLLFHRKKDTGSISNAVKKKLNAMKNPIEPEELERTNVEDLVREFLEMPDQNLQLLGEKQLSTALEEFVDKSLTASIPDTAFQALEKVQKKLTKNNKGELVKPSKIRESLAEESQQREQDSRREKESENSKKRTARKGSAKKDDDEEMVDADAAGKENNLLDDDDDDEDDPPVRKASKKKATPKTARSAPHNPQRKAARRRQFIDLDSDDEELVMEEAAKKKPSKSASRPKRSSAKRSVNYSLDDGDDDDEGSDAVVNLEDDSDDEVSVVDRKKKKSSNPRAKATNTGRARPKSRKNARQSLDDSDDEVVYAGATDDLDDDWGTAATRS